MQLKVYRDDTEKFIVALRERIRLNTFFTIVAVLLLATKVAPQIQANAATSLTKLDFSSAIPTDSTTLFATVAGIALQMLNLLKPAWVYRERNRNAI
jgi:hypothetical protein